MSQSLLFFEGIPKHFFVLKLTELVIMEDQRIYAHLHDCCCCNLTKRPREVEIGSFERNMPQPHLLHFKDSSMLAFIVLTYRLLLYDLSAIWS